MYNPKHFQSDVLQKSLDLIESYNFATLITIKDNHPEISHLPLILDLSVGPHGILNGHMAKANPQWKSFKDHQDVKVLFHGPHSYVSPRWYQYAPDNVPTWNYAVVHVTGKAMVIKDKELAFARMKSLVTHHDPKWDFKLSDQDRDDLLNEIVVFEIQISNIQGKFKLSQNRSELDRKNVAAQLRNGNSDLERETAALMN